MSFVWCKQISTADTTGYATRSYFYRLKLSFGSISKSKVMFSFEIIGTSSIIKILKIKFQTRLAGFRPNSEIIGKVRKMEKFYGHFVQLGK